MTSARTCNSDDLDNQLIAGDPRRRRRGHGAAAGGPDQGAEGPVSDGPADNPTQRRLRYTSIIPTVKPLDNIDCRKAIEYAMSPAAYQNAWAASSPAVTSRPPILPPVIPGYEDFDLYDVKVTSPASRQGQGRPQACGQPDGFATTSPTARTSLGEGDRRGVPAAAREGRHQGLARRGFLKATTSPDLRPPSYASKNSLGLCVNGWGADWNDGFGFSPRSWTVA